MSIEKIIDILRRRDAISYEEACDMVHQCQNELGMIIDGGGTYDDAADCIEYWLGLEPDYIECLLD